MRQHQRMSIRDQLVRWWPVLGLELRTPRVVLRPLGEEDLPGLIDNVLAGIHDRDWMPFAVPWTAGEPDQVISESLRYWWTTRAAIAPHSWELLFGIHLDDQIVGVQQIEARDFAVMRTIQSGSWLARRHQGAGIGTDMRAAVLMFAFDYLGAERAASSAFADNAASLRVSEKLGYRPNGTSWLPRQGAPAPNRNLLVTPETFRRPGWSLVVTGFEGVLGQLGC